MIEFESEEIEALQERIARKLGFRLVGHRLELYGVPLAKPEAAKSRQLGPTADGDGPGRRDFDLLLRVDAAVDAGAGPLRPLLASGGAPLSALVSSPSLQTSRRHARRRRRGCERPAGFACCQPHVLARHSSVLRARARFLRRQEGSRRLAVRLRAGASAAHGVRRPHARHAAGDAADEIMARLSSGDVIVLFAEGTSSDGGRVLPFKTSLFGAVTRPNSDAAQRVVVQTAAIVYTHLYGVPVDRADRPRIGWYGDMEMTSHAWQLLKNGPLRVRIKIGPPAPLEAFADRKALALNAERQVRRDVCAILRGRSGGEALEPAEPTAELRRLAQPAARGSEKWT